jgi:large subunit ribosomal protein L6
MSRIGKQPIQLPKGVEVKLTGTKVSVKGPKGQLERSLHSSIGVAVEGENALVTSKTGTMEDRKFHGLSRTLVNNMVVGVSSGYTKTLTLIGVGYRAAVAGKELQLTLGFSHPVIYPIDSGLTITVDKNTTIVIAGADKEKVGQTAANIRGFRPPEPYHGKGVRYAYEKIITKVGKSAGKK